MNTDEAERRSVVRSAAREFRNRCPDCGRGALLSGYLEPHDACTSYGAPNGGIKAHDAPPYITKLVVGHIIVPLMLLWEQTWSPPLCAHYAVWMPATLVLTLALLPRVKGAWIGLIWALRLHGDEHQ